MALLNFATRPDAQPSQSLATEMIGGWSIEVMPRTAAKVESFRALLPEGTLVYIAHIAGTPIISAASDCDGCASGRVAKFSRAMDHPPSDSMYTY